MAKRTRFTKERTVRECKWCWRTVPSTLIEVTAGDPVFAVDPALDGTLLCADCRSDVLTGRT